jgi:Lar family restriction alleviation protein
MALTETKMKTELPTHDYIINNADIAHALGSTELKPCPFCGRWAFSIGKTNKVTGNTVYSVNCSGTDCMVNTFSSSKDPAEARAKAIERWNRRTVKEAQVTHDKQAKPGR